MDNPNDVIDPDDSIGTAPAQCALLLASLAQNEAWSITVVFGSDGASLSPQDAFCALALLGHRIGYFARYAGNTPSAVGDLHNVAETLYGKPGRTALVTLWQEAAGIEQRKRQPKPNVANASAAEPHGTLDQPLPQLSPTPYEIEKGLHRALKGGIFKVYVWRDLGAGYGAAARTITARASR